MMQLQRISSYTKKFFFTLLVLSSYVPLIRAYDVLLEFKGAYFLPSDSLFKDIYHNGGAIYGPEITAQLYEQLYGFASVDFFNKDGRSIGLYSPTTINLIDIGIGLKYFVPFSCGDFYIGLGALPTRLRVENCSPEATPCQTQWGCGGIAKVGAYFDLPKSFIIDLFFDYSFVTISPKCCLTGAQQSHAARLNGYWFGSALGYRFN